MKRLYNEYSAAPHWEPDTQLIHTLVSFAAQRIWDEVVVMNDVCPRDAESQCHQTIATLFAENILRRAMDKRRKERRKAKQSNETV
jgi:hypothetical protein